MTAYPPEPWYLGGSLLASVFLVPVADLPPHFGDAFAPGTAPLILGSRAVVGVAAAHYAEGGVLAYDELLVAAPTLRGARPRITIPAIWVDSAASMAGGRALWGIPKQLAAFERLERPAPASGSAATSGAAFSGSESMRVDVAGSRVARVDARHSRVSLPGMQQLALPILQRTELGSTLSHNRVIGRIGALRARWTFAPDGPLGWLAGHRPVVSFAVREAAIVFGMRVVRG